MTDALTISKISHAYGKRKALEDVSFLIPQGRFTALLGPNGAGKSTLFSLITRLFDYREGSISLFGQDLGKFPGQALRQLGVVFQQPTLDLDLTVQQNLRYAADLHGLPRRIADPRIERVLARMELAPRRGDKARDLNGGHRRRVEIARALIHDPKLLLLDEPTVGLDVPTRKALISQIHELCRQDGLAVLWATHLVDEIDPLHDRLVVLHKGRIWAEGEAAEILAANGGSLGDIFSKLADGEVAA